MVEHLDGHTDIVHKMLYNDWLPWSDKYHYASSCPPTAVVQESEFVLHHNFQGNETKRLFVAALLEKGRRWNIW